MTCDVDIQCVVVVDPSGCSPKSPVLRVGLGLTSRQKRRLGPQNGKYLARSRKIILYNIVGSSNPQFNRRRSGSDRDGAFLWFYAVPGVLVTMSSRFWQAADSSGDDSGSDSDSQVRRPAELGTGGVMERDLRCEPVFDH